MVGNVYVFTKTSQMTSTGAIFTTAYQIKQLNPWPNSSASHVVNYSRLHMYASVSKGYVAIWRWPKNSWISDKPQRKGHNKSSPGNFQHHAIPAWIVSQFVQLLFDAEKYVLMLCVCGRWLFSNLVTYISDYPSPIFTHPGIPDY